jgi:hypothetical protein
MKQDTLSFDLRNYESGALLQPFISVFCRVLMVRYVLAGPKPSELVDVKLDLTFMYNTVTRSGSYFVRNVSLKLVSDTTSMGDLKMLSSLWLFSQSTWFEWFWFFDPCFFFVKRGSRAG